MSFPVGLKVDVRKVLRYGNYNKAISIDCIGGSLFCIRENEDKETKQRKIRLLEYLFRPEFWEDQRSKICLVGRLILLNKDHPRIPELGRFRPIRICSNIVKFM